MSRRSKNRRGSAILGVILLIMLGLGASIIFLKKAHVFLSLAGINKDQIDSTLQAESGREIAIAKVHRALDHMNLESKLQFVGGPNPETFTSISNRYAASAANALDFFEHMIVAQSYSGAGVQDDDHEFADFETAFPTDWTDSDETDSTYFQVKYTINPLTPVVEINPQRIIFEYEILIQTRAWGGEKFSQVERSEGLVASLTVQGAPFSQWALFIHSMLNQNGGIVTFAGGDTSSQAQEVYTGPVHVNETPYFMGSPDFNAIFRSGEDYDVWEFLTGTNYSGSPTFDGGYQENYDAIEMPTDIFNTTRLAAGDTSNTAATDNNSVSNADLRTWLQYYAGGSLSSGSSDVPDGIYIPYDSPSTLTPTGGIFVEGDIEVDLDVVQGSEDFNVTQWGGIDAAHKGCKFQKLSIDHLTTGVPSRDVYIGTKDSCDITYVFEDSSGTPVILEGRLNGVVHVEGKVDELGGVSRNQAAVARNFALNIAAQEDIRIVNDIQYEDAEYVEIEADGSLGSEVVADPTGPVDGSLVDQLSANVGAIIDEDSKTVLGIMSIKRNVYIHLNAPDNINVHAAIYAGNDDYYDMATGYGCGTNAPNMAGCGFGYEGWNSEDDKGHFKLLGSLSEYKSQTLGMLSSPQK